MKSKFWRKIKSNRCAFINVRESYREERRFICEELIARRPSPNSSDREQDARVSNQCLSERRISSQIGESKSDVSGENKPFAARFVSPRLTETNREWSIEVSKLA